MASEPSDSAPSAGDTRQWIAFSLLASAALISGAIWLKPEEGRYRWLERGERHGIFDTATGRYIGCWPRRERNRRCVLIEPARDRLDHRYVQYTDTEALMEDLRNEALLENDEVEAPNDGVENAGAEASEDIQLERPSR